VTGRQDAAREDFEAAIALEPNANFPYAYAALIAINEGRFDDAAQYVRVILEEFPDPNLYSRIVGTTVGGHDDFGPLVTVFVNVSMGRYEQAIEAAKEGHERMGPVPDLFVLQGMAYCNLGNNRGAEAAYSTAIDVSQRINWRHTWFTHLLRGDVRMKMLNRDGAEEDFAHVREVRPDLESLTSGFEQGEIDCTTLFGSVTLNRDPALPGAMEGMSAPEGAGDDR
jgi:tetratricopeptide (TPR) repeat protein